MFTQSFNVVRKTLERTIQFLWGVLKHFSRGIK